MSENGKDEGFLGRWSRLKTDAREAPVQAPVESAPPAARQHAEEAPPELPPVDSLTFDSDFGAFLHPKVDEDLKRTALRKLFSDPHFNVMDGLDVYIDDYSISEPIPPEMLAGMKQAQRILRWAQGHEDEAEEPHAEDAAAEDAAPPVDPAPALAAAPEGAAPDAPQTTDPLAEAVAKPV